jgi:hypothetical protein
MQGAQAATNSSTRIALIEQVAKLGEVPGVAFLRSELVHGPLLQSRVAAAYGLRRQGDSEALSAMIREWETSRTLDLEGNGGSGRVVEFLASCDSVEAVAALGKNLRQRPADVKLEVIEALGETNHWVFDQQTEQASVATLDAIETTLVAALEDTEEVRGMSEWRNGKHFSDPRICDMAARGLAERWPARYAFDPSGSLKARDRQRFECMNVWRQAHNLPSLQVSQARLVKVGRAEATKVTAIEWAPDGLKPEQAFASRITGFNNKLFSPDALVRVLCSFARRPEPGAAGLEFKAIKDEDLTGVRVVVRLLAGVAPAEDQIWSINERVVLGRKTLYAVGRGGTTSACASASEWEDFSEAVREAIAGSPETPFEISVRMVAGK